MKRLASLLLVLCVITHYAYEPLAEFYTDPDHAARAIFYALRGVEGAVLYGLVWRLAWCLARKRAAYSAAAFGGVSLACAWGVLESAQTAVCRVAVGIGEAAESERYSGLCDAATGLPVYGLTMLVALVVASLVQGADDAKG